MSTRKDPYASEEETLSLLRKDTRTPAERKLDQVLEERGSSEQGAELFPILRQIALELLTEQQEPVGWWDDKLGFFVEKHFDQLQPIYKSTPQRTWIGLTDEEIEQLWYEFHDREFGWAKQFARVIEAKLREKNA